MVQKIISKIDHIDFSHSFDVQNITLKAIDDNSFDRDCIGWCSDKNYELLSSINGGTLLISQLLFDKLKQEGRAKFFNIIVVEDPRKSFAEVLRLFFIKEVKFGLVHNSSSIDISVQFDKSKVIIDQNVVIEEGVTIGEFVRIGANTVIKAGSIIDSNVTIGSNCTIGGVGFGYEQNEDGCYELIPHIGNVHLHENVEVGNNVCIDRAVLGSTILSKNVKVDNLVHIAHGVSIGENSLIIANSMVAGSVKIGENTWISPSSSIRQKLDIGNNAMVGMGSVVVKNVANDSKVMGVPAKPIIERNSN